VGDIKFAFRNPAHYHCCQWRKETYHNGLALYTIYQKCNLSI
jgi:hypothetical protein